MNKVDLISKRTAIGYLKGRPKSGPHTSVVYLGEDYSFFLALRAAALSHSIAEVRQLGTAFHQCIARIQDDFCEFSNRLNQVNSSEFFWGTALASRNSAETPFLRDIVYCLCSVEMAKNLSSAGDLVLVYDSPWVGRTLHRHFSKMGVSNSLKQSVADRMDGGRLFLRLVMRVQRFLRVEVLRWVQFKLTGGIDFSAIRGNRKRIVIRSWFTRDSIDENGRYQDRNFGSLVGKLKRHGYDVWILPMIFNLEGSFSKLLSRMRICDEKFVLPEGFLSPLSLGNCLWREWKSLNLKAPSSAFHGVDFSYLIRRIHFERAFAPDRMSYSRVNELLMALKKKKFEIETLIYPFENNAVEKSFLCAAARSFPGSRTVGFQHSVWYREQLGMFLAPTEASNHPLPSSIVCSGSRYADILTKVGFPAQRIRVGPSLRFADLYRVRPPRVAKDGRKTILIILNFDLNQGKEMLQKVAAALSTMRDTEFELAIKTHPLLSEQKLADYTREIGIDSFSWATGRVPDLVAKADLVIMTYGSVSNLEVIVAGVPLLTVSLDGSFDFDPLWDTYPLDRKTANSEDFGRAIKQMLQLSTQDRALLGSFGRRILEDYFGPESDRDIEPFVEHSSM